jgi:hypothetical protein
MLFRRADECRAASMPAPMDLRTAHEGSIVAGLKDEFVEREFGTN